MKNHLNDYVIEIHQELKDAKEELEYLKYVCTDLIYLARCQGWKFKTPEEFREKKDES